MNLKISVERPSSQRVPRRSVRELKQPVVQQSPAVRAIRAPYPDYTGEQEITSLRNQQVSLRTPPARLVPPPQPKPEPVAEQPKPGLLGRTFKWLRSNAAPEKKLRVVETVPMGDKRMVAIIEADGQRFLVGCSSNGVSLLSSLKEEQSQAVTLDAAEGAELA
jgi:hypothetical protein